MKTVLSMFITLSLLAAGAVSAHAWDLDSLDRVHLLMTRAQVTALLGKPDQTGELPQGLQMEIYRAPASLPLAGTGCIYDGERNLVGQTFLFQGALNGVATDELERLGFTLMDHGDGGVRLLGKDDDTGEPLVVYVGQSDDLTVVSTFDKGVYERLAPSRKGT